jgi:hypothetical protein
MNCLDFDRVLADLNSLERAALPPKAQEHLQACSRCREMADLLLAIPGDAFLRPDLARTLEQKLTRTLKPVRPLAPVGRYATALLVLFGAIAIFCGLGMRPFGLRVLNPLDLVLIFGPLAGAAGLLALSLASQMSPGARMTARPAWILPAILLSLFAIFAALIPFHPESNFWHGRACFFAGMKVAIPTGVALWLLLRRGAFLHPKTAGATAGLLAGLAGVAALEIHCPVLAGGHIEAFHWSVALVSALAGLAAGTAVEPRVRRTA